MLELISEKVKLKQKSLLIFIPAFNEEKAIGRVLDSLPKKINGQYTVDVLVVNDGSEDKTKDIAIKFGANVLSHNSNKGVGMAFQTAVNFSLKRQFDILISIDADGQFDPGQIGSLIQPIFEEEADFCIGNRFSNSIPENMPKIRFWGNKQISRMVSFVSSTKIYDASCGFRAYSKDALYSLNLQGSYTYTHETILDLLQKGFVVQQIPISVRYFDGRISRVANSLIKYGFKTSIIIFKCLKDYKPLQFFLAIALFVLFFAFIIGSLPFFHWVKTGEITPYKSFGFIALSLCGISVLLMTLAFIADILNRMRNNQEKILYLTKKQFFERD